MWYKIVFGIHVSDSQKIASCGRVYVRFKFLCADLVVTVKVDSLDIYMLYSCMGWENTISVRLTRMCYLHINHFVPKKLHQQPGINLFCASSFCYFNRAKGCHIDLFPAEVFWLTSLAQQYYSSFIILFVNFFPSLQIIFTFVKYTTLVIISSVLWFSRVNPNGLHMRTQYTIFQESWYFNDCVLHFQDFFSFIKSWC
jgi:hypothetical protein